MLNGIFRDRITYPFLLRMVCDAFSVLANRNISVEKEEVCENFRVDLS